ncbi:MAG TPA: hypothetical protein PLR25_18475, partial [Planctomycetaceae bacterium]|nr:hypothetical protein [Planctomycetaceae bacterium]
PSGQTIALLSNDTCRGHRAAPINARSGAESGASPKSAVSSKRSSRTSTLATLGRIASGLEFT